MNTYSIYSVMLVVLPKLSFYNQHIDTINNILQLCKAVLLPTFVIYFTYIYIKNFFTGSNSQDVYIILPKVFFMAAGLVYMYPIFTWLHRIFTDIGLSIFPKINITYLNQVYINVIHHISFPLKGITAKGFLIDDLSIFVLKSLFIISNIAIYAIFLFREVLLLIGLMLLPFFICLSFFEEVKNKAIKLISMMLEFMFWFVMFCILLSVIFPPKWSHTDQANASLKIWATHLKDTNYINDNPNYVVAVTIKLISKSLLVILSVVLVPLITNSFFHGRAGGVAASMAAAGGYMASKTMSRALTKGGKTIGKHVAKAGVSRISSSALKQIPQKYGGTAGMPPNRSPIDFAGKMSWKGMPRMNMRKE